jgi:cytosine/adenosine deaminase-related metal-dependent hydrolase
VNAADQSPKQILSAAWVAPMDQPMIRDGAVVIQAGHIVAVGEVRQLRAEHPDAVHGDCGNVVLLPGLVNAHVHLDLTGTPRPPGPISFADWVQHLIAHAVPYQEPSHWIQKAKSGCRHSLGFGVTAVGDICGRFARVVRAALIDEPIHITSYGEISAMAQRRHLLEPRLAAAVDATGIPNSLRIGITPHAPYSIEAEGYRRCLAAAKAQRLPLATHLAELPYEAKFLSHHSGPLRDLWNLLGGWDDQVPTFDGGPIRYAQSLGLLAYPILLAHVNYCDDNELAILAKGSASVVYCPRTHQYFGHPPHRWREMLAAGINVALGTDSTASSPDLNLLDDLRLVHRLASDMPVETLWQLVTVRAAKAIDDSRVGVLTVGKRADIVAFAAEGPEPLRDILQTSALPNQVWVAGAEQSIGGS